MGLAVPSFVNELSWASAGVQPHTPSRGGHDLRRSRVLGCDVAVVRRAVTPGAPVAAGFSRARCGAAKVPDHVPAANPGSGAAARRTSARNAASGRVRGPDHRACAAGLRWHCPAARAAARRLVDGAALPEAARDVAAFKEAMRRRAWGAVRRARGAPEATLPRSPACRRETCAARPRNPAPQAPNNGA